MKKIHMLVYTLPVLVILAVGFLAGRVSMEANAGVGSPWINDGDLKVSVSCDAKEKKIWLLVLPPWEMKRTLEASTVRYIIEVGK